MRSEAFPSLQDLITIGVDGLKGIFEEISNGITITDEHSRIIYVNPAFTKITGYQASEVLGDNPGILHSGRHDRAFYEKMWSDLRLAGRWQGEIWNRCKSGELVPELLTITRITNKHHQQFYVGVFSDISLLIQKNETRLHLALHDPLTGLCNRKLFDDRFNVIINEYNSHRFQRESTIKQVVLLYIDLDRFKKINDTFGHLVGDNTLVFVANALKSCSRIGDTVARIGGDEFAVILTEILSKEDVILYCNRLRDAISLGTEVNGALILPALSIGACFFPSEATTIELLTAYADKAMYHAKKNKCYLTFYSEIV